MPEYQATIDQQKAIEHDKGPCLVLAGAGTGKTSVITKRIENLVVNKNIKPDKILALTFTDKAAREMEERVDTLLPLGYSNVKIGTFHQYCHELITNNLYWFKYKNKPTALTDAEEISLIRRNISKLPKLRTIKERSYTVNQVQDIIKFIHKAKEELLDPPELSKAIKKRIELLKNNSEINEEGIAEKHSLWLDFNSVYEALENIYIEESVLSYADMMHKAYLLLKNHPTVLMQEQDKFEYFLVDEFQDTNKVQNEIIKLLAGKSQNIMVVGDDDQSIYRFRGANLDNIMEFKINYPKAGIIVLKDNFRSTQNILDTAYRLIQNNNPNRLEVTEKVDKKIVSHSSENIPIKYWKFSQSIFENESVCDEIIRLIDDQNIDPVDIAILARSHSHLTEIISLLYSKEIPYQYISDNHFFHIPSITACLKVLRFIAYPEDNHNLYNLLIREPFNIEWQELQTIFTDSQYYNRSLYIELKDRLENNKFNNNPALTTALENLGLALASFADKPSQILLKYLYQSGWYKTLIDGNLHKETEAIANLLNEIQTWENLNPLRELTELIDYFNLLVESDEKIKIEDAEAKPEGVQVMTAHSSKGLEFKAVFIISASSLKFPMKRMPDGTGMDLFIDLDEDLALEHIHEERRLMYVSITRAKKYLYISCSNRYKEGQYIYKNQIFIDEARGNQPLIEINSESSLLLGLKVDDAIDTSINLDHSQEATFNSNIFTPSQIDEYVTCPYRFYQKFIMKVQTPVNYNVNLGISVHNTLKDYYHLLKEGESPDLKIIYINNWQAGGYSSKESEEETYDDALKSLSLYIAKNQLLNIEPLFTEYGFKYKISENASIKGSIDRIDPINGDQNTIRILDYKTGKKPKTTRGINSEIALGLYVLAMESMNFIVKEATYHYVLHDEIVKVPLDNGKLSDLKVNCLNVINKIEKAKFVSDFPALPNITNCKYCDFSDSCDKRFNEI